MKKKLLKLFVMYSYVTVMLYVASESFLDCAKWINNKTKGTGKANLKVESLWKTTLKRFKEGCKIIDES